MATRRLNPVTVAWDSPGLMHLYGSQPQYLGGQEGAEGMNPTPVNNPWLMAGDLKASGKLTPQAMKDYLASQEYGADARLNPDNTITYTPVAPVDGFDLGEMLAPMALGGFAFAPAFAGAAGAGAGTSGAGAFTAGLEGAQAAIQGISNAAGMGAVGGAAGGSLAGFGAGLGTGLGVGAGIGGSMDWSWLDSVNIPDIDWTSAPTGGSMDAVAPWTGGGGGWDYGEFLKSVGIDPSSTQFSGGTMSNAEIMSQINGNPSLWQQIKNIPGIGNIPGILGKALPGLLGAYASNQQSKDYLALADKYAAFGAPSRARYEASYLPGFSMENEPGYKDALDQTTKSFLHKASVAGNPVDSPNAWMQTLKDVNSTFAFPALNQYRTTNANAGGLANMASAAPGFDASAARSNANIYNALGDAAGDIFNPPKSGYDLLAQLLSNGGRGR